MALADTLLTGLTNMANLIAQVTESPCPNYSVDGVSVSKADYLAMLLEQYANMQKNYVIALGPATIYSLGR